MNTTLSLQQARNLQLATQGLLHASLKRACYPDFLAAIQYMSLLQIDTIHVVVRSLYLVLFSRLGSYPPGWLKQVLAQRANCLNTGRTKPILSRAKTIYCCAIACSNQNGLAGNITPSGCATISRRSLSCCSILQSKA